MDAYTLNKESNKENIKKITSPLKVVREIKRPKTPVKTILIDSLIKNYNISTSRNLGEYVHQSKAIHEQRKQRQSTPNAFKAKAKSQPKIFQRPKV